LYLSKTTATGRKEKRVWEKGEREKVSPSCMQCFLSFASSGKMSALVRIFINRTVDSRCGNSNDNSNNFVCSLLLLLQRLLALSV